MNKILSALESLCRAVPGAVGLSVHLHDGHVHFDVVAKTDDAAVAIGEQLDVKVHQSGNETRRWVSGARSVEGQYLTIRGPHHEVIAVPALDESKVAAALAQAQAAVRT